MFQCGTLDFLTYAKDAVSSSGAVRYAEEKYVIALSWSIVVTITYDGARFVRHGDSSPAHEKKAKAKVALSAVPLRSHDTSAPI